MANKHMKRCPSLLIIREMQVKTIMRYYLIPVRMTIIKKSTKNKCWRGCGEKGPSYSVSGNVDSCRHYGKQDGGFFFFFFFFNFIFKTLQLLKKIKIEFNPAIPLLNINLEKLKFEKVMHLSVHSSALHSS